MNKRIVFASVLSTMLNIGGCNNMKMDACAAFNMAMDGATRHVMAWLRKSSPDQWICKEGPLLVLLTVPDDSVIFVKLMLSKGADPNAQAPDGRAALHMAAAKLHAELIETLLDAGADVNLRGQNGLTPLMEAADVKGAKEYVLETVELLLRRGADPKLQDSRGATASDLARARGNEKVAKALSWTDGAGP